jgi:hypothetical protein
MIPDVPEIGLGFLVDAGQIGVLEPAANLDRRCRLSTDVRIGVLRSFVCTSHG